MSNYFDRYKRAHECLLSLEMHGIDSIVQDILRDEGPVLVRNRDDVVTELRAQIKAYKETIAGPIPEGYKDLCENYDAFLAWRENMVHKK